MGRLQRNQRRLQRNQHELERNQRRVKRNQSTMERNQSGVERNQSEVERNQSGVERNQSGIERNQNGVDAEVDAETIKLFHLVRENGASASAAVQPINQITMNKKRVISGISVKKKLKSNSLSWSVLK